MRDLILSVRADEQCHREVNHHFADMPAWEPIEHTVVNITEDKKFGFARKDDKAN